MGSSLGPRPNDTQQQMDYITPPRSGDVIHPLLRKVGSGAETKWDRHNKVQHRIQ